MSLLSVVDLRVSHEELSLIKGISFEVAPGERLGIIGESGSGKSLTALAIMRLLSPNLSVSGKVILEDTDLLTLRERELARLRGDRIAMIFQEPMAALNPLMRVGSQIEEAVLLHRDVSNAGALTRSLDLLHKVGFPDPQGKYRSFPHQLSGGQRQRVMIAMALACDPVLLLADEPTTALDVTVQSQVLATLAKLVEEEGSALILISHDLAVVSSVCERLMVMYGGTIVEFGPTPQLLQNPHHPYTAGLLATSLAISSEHRVPLGHLPTIAGIVPSAKDTQSGCVFLSRCDRASRACSTAPTLSGGESGWACWHPVNVGTTGTAIPLESPDVPLESNEA